MYSNSLDLAVLYWFHLFGYHNDDLHWKKVVSDVEDFRKRLLACLGLTQEEWESKIKAKIEKTGKLKSYRDIQYKKRD